MAIKKRQHSGRQRENRQSRPAGGEDKLLAADWEPEYWRSRCAWCGSSIEDKNEAFIIPVSLHEYAFREFAPNTIQPLYLVSINKVVPMIVVGKDSPLKERGKDAYFQTCCQICAENLKKELRTSLLMAREP
ncbi:MAG: hypothetical protein ACP5MG_00635 [Verrucomicrobiia bacterium]|jgi:hypothetical protein